MKNILTKFFMLVLFFLAVICFAAACATTGHVHFYTAEYKLNDDTHWFECSCGEKKDETAHKFVYGVCACGFEDENYVHTHEFSDKYIYDSVNHWYQCGCGEKKDVAAHEHVDKKCICGHEVYVETIEPEEPVHTHSYDRQTVGEQYLVNAATCEKKAVYHYSCKCGEEGNETFEYGNALGHSFTNYKDNEDNTKTAKCDNGCGKENTIEKEHEHNYTKEVVAPTCEEKGYTLYGCECGDTYHGEEKEKLGHDYGEFISDNDGIHHTKICKNDENHKVTESCSGGKATCTEKAVCGVCKTQYGTTEEHDYSKDVEVLYKLSHIYGSAALTASCSVCGQTTEIYLSPKETPEEFKFISKSSDENSCALDCIYNYKGADYLISEDLSVNHYNGEYYEYGLINVLDTLYRENIELVFADGEKINCKNFVEASYDCAFCKQTQKLNLKAMHNICVYDNFTVSGDCNGGGMAFGFCEGCEKKVEQSYVWFPHVFEKIISCQIIDEGCVVELGCADCELIVPINSNDHHIYDFYNYDLDYHEEQTECGNYIYVWLNFFYEEAMERHYGIEQVEYFEDDNYIFRGFYRDIDHYQEYKFVVGEKPHLVSFTNYETGETMEMEVVSGQSVSYSALKDYVETYYFDNIGCENTEVYINVWCEKCHNDITVTVTDFHDAVDEFTHTMHGTLHGDDYTVEIFEYYITDGWCVDFEYAQNFDIYFYVWEDNNRGDNNAYFCCCHCGQKVYVTVINIPEHTFTAIEGDETFTIKDGDIISVETAEKLGIFYGDLEKDEIYSCSIWCEECERSIPIAIVG